MRHGKRQHQGAGVSVDERLIERIAECISGGGRDAGEISQTLREKFPEYSRRPVPALKIMVERAMSEMARRATAESGGGVGGGDGSQQRHEEGGEEEEGSDGDVKIVEHHSLNSSLVAFYKKTSPALTPPAPLQPSGTPQPATSVPAVSPKRPRPEQAASPEPGPASKKKKQLTLPSKRQVATAVAREAGFDGGGISESGPTLAATPTVRYADLGGIDSALQDVRELIEYPLTHPEIYTHLGVEPPRGILLHGPPGCGKTMLANAIAGELGVPFFSLSAPEIVSGMSGESEAKIRGLFSDAVSMSPCIVFIDEIDAITPKRDTAQREMERRIVAQLLTCLDGLSSEETRGSPVIVIGATNRPDSLDPALRRAGRFDREISLGIPDVAARARILRVIARKLRLSGDFDFEAIARATSGFVGADLNALAKEAAINAVHRIFVSLFKKPDPQIPAAEVQATALATATTVTTTTAADVPGTLENRSLVSNALRALREPLTPEQLAGLFITMEDFQVAVKKVQPSAKREGFSTIPNVRWADVGALGGVRAQLIDAIVGPIKQPDLYKAVGISTSSGVLLFGPPGCGKTLIAKAVAAECGANFIGIKGPQLLNKYVGEAEKAVRQLFNRAASSAPCVIFFDELDALCPKRAEESDHTGASRVVNQLLTEMDGLESRKDVFVIAATNRPDVIDKAMLRPGRLDKLIAVDLPNAAGRADILRAVCQVQRTPLAPDVDLPAIANDPHCDGFSGADLAALVKEAALRVLHEALQERGILLDHATGPTSSPTQPTRPMFLTHAHFIAAFSNVSRSVSPEDEQLYLRLKKSLHHMK